MFTCTCCSPSHSYTKQKNLYRHQRKYDPNYTDPLTRIAKERRDAYYADPNKCLMCGEMLAYDDVVSGRKDKFCSRSCAAKLNGSLYPKRGAPRFTAHIEGKTIKLQPISTETRVCLRCKIPLTTKTTKTKYCSQICSAQHIFETITIPKILSGEPCGPRPLKRYLIQERSWKCDMCLNTEWLGDPIPLEMDHINGNPEDNRLENLRLLCPNCHAKTPTAKGKNRGNGRWNRKQRYAEGKSY